jgi:hypothetical protein
MVLVALIGGNEKQISQLLQHRNGLTFHKIKPSTKEVVALFAVLGDNSLKSGRRALIKAFRSFGPAKPSTKKSPFFLRWVSGPRFNKSNRKENDRLMAEAIELMHAKQYESANMYLPDLRLMYNQVGFLQCESFTTCGSTVSYSGNNDLIQGKSCLHDMLTHLPARVGKYELTDQDKIATARALVLLTIHERPTSASEAEETAACDLCAEEAAACELYAENVSQERPRPYLNLYLVLGLKAIDDPNEDQIRKAYLRAVRITHPDRNLGDSQAAQRFQWVCEAFETLSDPFKRLTYELDSVLKEYEI